MAEMTNQEFDQAIEAIRQGQIMLRERRVMAAATFMMRELCSVPDNFQPTLAQIIDFIDSLDKPFRKLLKRAADDLKEERALVLACHFNPTYARESGIFLAC